MPSERNSTKTKQAQQVGRKTPKNYINKVFDVILQKTIKIRKCVKYFLGAFGERRHFFLLTLELNIFL